MNLPTRKSIRLPHYDYSDVGDFFTVNTFKRQPLFGKVVDGEVVLTSFGKIAENTWQQLPDHFPGTKLDAFVVMPNHVHGIIWITKSSTKPAKRPVRAQHAAPIHKGPAPGSLGAIIRSYKSAVTKAINQQRGHSGQSVWHRNYYERVIRSQRELEAIRHYVTHNAAKWPLDEMGPQDD